MNGALTRTSKKVYLKRPPANCRTARWAWDSLVAERPDRSLEWIRLVEGSWMAGYTDGEYGEICAVEARINARLKVVN
jgi:hypothetical protein